MPKLISFTLHVLVFLLLCVTTVTKAPPPVSPRDIGSEKPLFINILHTKKTGDPGGGDRSPIPATRGDLVRFARKQFVPPSVVRRPEAQIQLEPTLLADKDIVFKTALFNRIGDPLGPDGPPSLGTGLNGIGEKGTGSYGKGPGHGSPGGEDDGGGVALGGPTTDPVVIYKTEPEFSEQARKAKLQGTVTLVANIGADGRAHDIHVSRGLGLGLDEQAINAVALWRFRPAYRSGRPVAVAAVIEINFRLL